MSSIVLPSTVEELNYMQSQSLYIKSDNTQKELENIIVANNYKQEASLFDAVSWTDYESYLNFEENQNTLRGAADDCIVPGDADVRQQQQQRNDSFSSSAMEDSKNFAYKTFSTVCVDSGSTCISSEHSYVSPSPVPNNVYRGLDEEETYQNLSAYFKQSPEVHNTDSSLSCVSPPLSESLSDYSVLNNFSAIGHCSSQDGGGFQEVQHTLKRPAESPDLEPFVSSKRSCSGESYSEVRKKNNLSSKNCRKTRKEKQKEMEARVQELEREREQLNSSIEMLEKAIKAHHVHLCSILGSRQQMVA